MTLCEWFLGDAKKQKERFVGDSINWSDLRVVDCESAVSFDGAERYIITISEASHCQRLHGWLIGRLADTEFGNTRVTMLFEW